MNREIFKAELKRCMAADPKPIVSSFMTGTGICGIANSWLWKLFAVIEKEQVSKSDMRGLADLIIFRRAQGILTYFPTDKEMKQLIRDYREIEEAKAKTKAAEAQVMAPSSSARTTPPLPSHKQKIICADCGKVHVADELCPMVYPP